MASHQSFPVISLNYCVPNRINLQINTDKGTTYDINGNAVFKMEDTSFSLHNRRVLYDVQQNPIVTLYNKTLTLHNTCKVFRGKSNDPSELLFSAKRSSFIPRSNVIKLEVFLAENKNKSVCDFRAIVHNGKSSCNVYAGESPTIIATMNNNDGFNVWVDSNVDHAFIVALLMIVNDIKTPIPLGNLAMNTTTLAANVLGNKIKGARTSCC